jgi:hypothetical protein
MYYTSNVVVIYNRDFCLKFRTIIIMYVCELSESQNKTYMNPRGEGNQYLNEKGRIII